MQSLHETEQRIKANKNKNKKANDLHDHDLNTNTSIYRKRDTYDTNITTQIITKMSGGRLVIKRTKKVMKKKQDLSKMKLNDLNNGQ